MSCGSSSNALLLVLLSLQQYPAHGGVKSALQAQTGCHATASRGCEGTCDDGSACYTSKHGTCGCAGATPCEDIESGSCSPGSCSFHQTCQEGKGAFGGCGCVPTPSAAPGPLPRPAQGLGLDPTPLFACSSGTCMASADATLSRQDCEAMCMPQHTLYRCSADKCEEAPTGMSKSACEASCGPSLVLPPPPAPITTTNSSCPGAIPTCIAEVPNCMKCAGGAHGSSVFCLECCPGCTPVAKPPYTRCNCSAPAGDVYGDAKGIKT